jgi:hypothetical protein
MLVRFIGFIFSSDGAVGWKVCLRKDSELGIGTVLNVSVTYQHIFLSDLLSYQM